MAHCADGKTEAHAGEGACGAEDERKEHRGAPEILEHFLAVLPKPSTHHAEIIPLIRDSALGQVVSDRWNVSGEESRDPCQVLQLGSSRCGI